MQNSWFILTASGSYRKSILAYHGNGGHSVSDLPVIFKRNSIVPDTSYRSPARSSTTAEPTTTSFDWLSQFPLLTKTTTTTTRSPQRTTSSSESVGHCYLIVMIFGIVMFLS